MSIVDVYLAGLKEALPPEELKQLSLATGATAQQLEALRAAYPQCPAALLELLSRINGTWWQPYGDTKIAVLVLGSDVFEYPYYLMSVEQMLEERDSNENSIADIYDEFLDEDAELLDPRIDPNISMGRRLCFSQCMNNGGTSILYLDFTPTQKGVIGQVVRFLHDPDSYAVIANSFEEYLQNLIDEDFAFVSDSEEEALEVDLLTVQRGTLSPVLSCALKATSEELPNGERAIRFLAERIVRAKGFFALHADPDSHLMYDSMFMLYSHLKLAASYEDFIHPTEQQTDYERPCYLLMLTTSLDNADYGFCTDGYAEGFLRDWWDARLGAGKIVPVDGGYRFETDYARQLLREMQALGELTTHVK